MAAVACAQNLQIKKISIATMSELSKNASLLTLRGVSLPLEHKIAITSRYAILSSEDGEMAKWSSALRMKPKKEWTIAAPTFGDALRNFDLGAPLQLSEPDAANFSNVLHQTVICDVFLRKMTASEGDIQKAREFSTMLVQALENLTVQETPTCEGVESPAVDFIMSCLRGILALVSPIPGIGGSTLADVTFVTSGSVRKSLGGYCGGEGHVTLKT